MPFVEPRLSPVAGRGVFARDAISKDQVVALYPGVYTPPLPTIGDYDHQYLANQVAPSGAAVEHNAYILNLQGKAGGYLDALALNYLHNDKLVVMTSNPSACAHLINHSPTESNVRFESFIWNDILEETQRDESDKYFPIPNRRRSDGTPWYFDGNDVICFDPSASDLITGGAAFVTTREIQQDEELFLFYHLSKPYAEWAKDWYVGREDVGEGASWRR